MKSKSETERPGVLASLRDLLQLVESNAPDGYYTEDPAITRAWEALNEADQQADTRCSDCPERYSPDRRAAEMLKFCMDHLLIIDPHNADKFQRGGTVRIYDTIGAVRDAMNKARKQEEV